MYIDELQGEDVKTGEIKAGYHIRLKGVGDKTLKAVLNQINNKSSTANNQEIFKKYETVSPFDIYEEILKGKSINFDLCFGKPVFRYSNGLAGIKTLSTAERTVKI